MKIARLYNENGSQSCITWKKQPDGLITVNNDYYDAEGYYRADKSFTSKDWEQYRLIEELEAAKDICYKVVML